MPFAAPKICACGRKVPWDTRCPCQLKRDAERKARHDANRPTARERGYDGKWQRERAAYLKANPKCRRCPAPATVVDHIIPHKGNQKLFWSRSNWQPLCASCHARWKQALECSEASNG